MGTVDKLGCIGGAWFCMAFCCCWCLSCDSNFFLAGNLLSSKAAVGQIFRLFIAQLRPLVKTHLRALVHSMQREKVIPVMTPLRNWAAQNFLLLFLRFVTQNFNFRLFEHNRGFWVGFFAIDNWLYWLENTFKAFSGPERANWLRLSRWNVILAAIFWVFGDDHKSRHITYLHNFNFLNKTHQSLSKSFPIHSNLWSSISIVQNLSSPISEIIDATYL